MKALFAELVREHKKLKTLSAKKDAQEKKVNGLRETFMGEMNLAGTDTYKGPSATISISHSIVPDVESWPDFYKYIKRYDAFDLLQRRAAVTAYRDRIEDGKKVSGVKAFNKATMRITLTGKK